MSRLNKFLSDAGVCSRREADRLIESGHIREAYKKIAPDGRRRQYYQITEEGQQHLAALLTAYRRFSENMERLLEGGEESDGK